MNFFKFFLYIGFSFALTASYGTILFLDNFEAPTPAIPIGAWWNTNLSYGLGIPNGAYSSHMVKGSCAGSSGGGNASLYVTRVGGGGTCDGISPSYEYANSFHPSGLYVNGAIVWIPGLSCYGNLTLDFDYKLPGGNTGTDYARVGIGIAGPGPAPTYLNIPGFSTGTPNWTHVAVNFPNSFYNYIQTYLRFEWLYDNLVLNQQPLAVDNVRIQGEWLFNTASFTHTCVSNCGSSTEVHELDGSASAMSPSWNINEWIWNVTPNTGFVLNGQGTVNPTLNFNTTGTWNVCLTVNDTTPGHPYPTTPACAATSECKTITVSAPLATQALALYGDQKESSVLLYWETENPLDVLEYKVEKIRENSTAVVLADSIPFTQRYFEDLNVDQGVYSYRILASGRSGEVWKSNELRMSFDVMKNLNLYPNPLIGSKLTLEGIPVGEKFHVMIINQNGQSIFHSDESISLDNRFIFNMENIPAGHYILKYNSSQSSKNLRFVKI